MTLLLNPQYLIKKKKKNIENKINSKKNNKNDYKLIFFSFLIYHLPLKVKTSVRNPGITSQKYSLQCFGYPLGKGLRTTNSKRWQLEGFGYGWLSQPGLDWVALGTQSSLYTKAPHLSSKESFPYDAKRRQFEVFDKGSFDPEFSWVPLGTQASLHTGGALTPRSGSNDAKRRLRRKASPVGAQRAPYQLELKELHIGEGYAPYRKRASQNVVSNAKRWWLFYLLPASTKVMQGNNPKLKLKGFFSTRPFTFFLNNFKINSCFNTKNLINFAILKLMFFKIGVSNFKKLTVNTSSKKPNFSGWPLTSLSGSEATHKTKRRRSEFKVSLTGEGYAASRKGCSANDVSEATRKGKKNIIILSKFVSINFYPYLYNKISLVKNQTGLIRYLVSFKEFKKYCGEMVSLSSLVFLKVSDLDNYNSGMGNFIPMRVKLPIGSFYDPKNDKIKLRICDFIFLAFAKQPNGALISSINRFLFRGEKLLNYELLWELNSKDYLIKNDLIPFSKIKALLYSGHKLRVGVKKKDFILLTSINYIIYKVCIFMEQIYLNKNILNKNIFLFNSEYFNKNTSQYLNYKQNLNTFNFIFLSDKGVLNTNYLIKNLIKKNGNQTLTNLIVLINLYFRFSLFLFIYSFNFIFYIDYLNLNF